MILSISADFFMMKFLEFPISLRQLDLKYFEFSRQNHIFPPATHCLKSTQNVAFGFFLILAFFTNFWSY